MAKSEKKAPVTVNRNVSLTYVEGKGYDIDMGSMSTMDFIKFIGTASASIVKIKDLAEAERELVLSFQKARANALEEKEKDSASRSAKPKAKVTENSGKDTPKND